MDKDELKVITKLFLREPIKNSNIIIEFEKKLQHEDSKIVKKSLKFFNKVLIALLKEKYIHKPNNLPSNCKTARDNYDSWLFTRYNEIQKQMLDLSHPETHMMALMVYTRLILTEYNNPFDAEEIKQLSFPFSKLKNLIRSLLSFSTHNSKIIHKFRENLQYPDFLFATLYALSQVLTELNENTLKDLEKSSSKEDNQKFNIFLENLFMLIETMTLPIPGPKPLDNIKLFKNVENECEEADENDSKVSFTLPYEEAQNYFDEIWDIVLNLKFPQDLYKRLLVVIPDKVLIHLKTPVKLTDFFLDAFNYGGAFSIMALQGVYILINQYNLEYPDFYNKLYTLFQPTIFQAKYKPRFFMLCTTFFSSPLLPEYIVAAFIKRSCRLMLTAPSCSLILLIKFVANLLMNCQSLHIMFNNHQLSSMEDDPFLEDEENPKLCRAKESSLWELDVLQEHPMLGISKAASFYKRRLPDFATDVSKFVDISMAEEYEKAAKVRSLNVATTFYKPEALFKHSEDQMSDMWSIC